MRIRIQNIDTLISTNVYMHERMQYQIECFLNVNKTDIKIWKCHMHVFLPLGAKTAFT